MQILASLRAHSVLWATLFLGTLSACSDGNGKGDGSPRPELEPPRLPLIDMQGPIGGNRPVEVKTPKAYDPDSSAKYPLLILLHGYGSDAAAQDKYLGMSAAALKRGYIFAAPDGTTAPIAQKKFWNAGEVCCNFEGSQVDDLAYLRDLIRQMSARYAVDPARVYMFGHSNGAFMAHRFACDLSPWVTAIAGLAGSLRSDPNTCNPSQPVGVVTIHGTSDETIRYEGGRFSPFSPPYPSAETTIARWSAVNGCDVSLTRSAPFSVLAASQANDTTALRYGACKSGVGTELWKIEGAGGVHVPAFDAAFIPRVLDFFDSQKR